MSLSKNAMNKNIKDSINGNFHRVQLANLDQLTLIAETIMTDLRVDKRTIGEFMKQLTTAETHKHIVHLKHLLEQLPPRQSSGGQQSDRVLFTDLADTILESHESSGESSLDELERLNALLSYDSHVVVVSYVGGISPTWGVAVLQCVLLLAAGVITEAFICFTKKDDDSPGTKGDVVRQYLLDHEEDRFGMFVDDQPTNVNSVQAVLSKEDAERCIVVDTSHCLKDIVSLHLYPEQSVRKNIDLSDDSDQPIILLPSEEIDLGLDIFLRSCVMITITSLIVFITSWLY